MLHIDYIKHKKVYFAISICFIVLALGVTAIFGVNLDIQFKGGSIVNYSFTGDLNQDAFEATIEEFTGGRVNIQRQEDIASGTVGYVVSSLANESVDSDAQLALEEHLRKTYPDNNITVLSSNNVDPTIGASSSANAWLQLHWRLCSWWSMWRSAFARSRPFGWRDGSGRTGARCHMVYGAFVVFGIPINDNFIAWC
jgi:preprotein translocase subunit SecF